MIILKDELEVHDTDRMYPGCCYLCNGDVLFLESKIPTIFRKVMLDGVVGDKMEDVGEIKLIGNLKPIHEYDVKSLGDGRIKIDTVTKIEVI